MEYKKCTGPCGLEKSLADFYFTKSRQTYTAMCKTCTCIQTGKYKKEHRENNNIRQIQYYQENKNDICKKNKQYYEKNKDKVKEYHKQYYIKHRNEINERDMKRKKDDVNFRIRAGLRSRLNRAIKNGQKAGSAVKDLGCSIEFLKQYLSQKFYLNSETGEIMSWDNYGLYGWHIDHIVPLSSFDLTNREQFLKAFHYTNLQPLWAKDNLLKSNK
jgi:hypothetical protein